MMAQSTIQVVFLVIKVLPDPISILATADTVDELKNTQNTALSKLKKEVLTAFLKN